MNKEIKIGSIVEVYTGPLSKALDSDFAISKYNLNLSEIDYGFIKSIDEKHHRYFIKFFKFSDSYLENYGVHEIRILRVIDSESYINE
jgi:hypothetical protein